MTPRLLAFPKFHRGLPLAELAQRLRGLGLDGVALPVREGYWTAPATLARDLPAAAAVLRAAGLDHGYLIGGWSPAALGADPTPLRICAEAGVRQVRLGYWDRPAGPEADPAAALRAARDELARLVEPCLRLGIQVVVQVHHGRLVQSATAAWTVVQGLPPAAVGVKLDPGNQAFEGFEAWDYALPLVGAHLAALGVKDVAWSRGADGRWRRDWCELAEGINDWPGLGARLAAARFAGPCVLHPFYHERDLAAQEAALGRDVVFWRRCLAGAAGTAAG